MTALTLQNIYRAQQTIAPLIRKTPLIHSQPLSEQVDSTVYLKLEQLQVTGAFKARGAANRLLNLSPEGRQRGVVTVSTGNHGRAVAYMARQLGLNAAVCISERVPQNKVEALRRLEAEVVIHGQSQDDAEVVARELVAERGATLVPPFDDPFIVAGQGTLGLELLADAPALDMVLVPLSGGGLIGGVALALKTANPAIRVVGVSMEQGAVMYHSLQAGKPVQLPEAETLADSLQGGVGLDNQYTFGLTQQYVDDVLLLTEDEIAAGLRYAFWQHQLVLEGAGAVGIAALLAGKVAQPGRHIVALLSGGNIDLNSFLKLVQNTK